MNHKNLLRTAAVGIMALAFAVPVFAQDATAVPDASGSAGTTDTSMQGTGTLSCDSSVILLAGLAQRYFGYAPSDVTLGSYVYGQYSPLFDMQGMTGDTAGTTGDTAGTAGDTAGTTTDSSATTGDASGAAANPTLAPNSVFLSAPVIAGEDPACTQLRTSLESFFSTQLQSADWDTHFRSGMSGMSSSAGNG